MIPDQSDLNVYNTQGEGGTNLGCCGPTIKDDTKVRCCGSSKETKSRCSGSNGVVEKGDKLAEVDLNEWAGKRSWVPAQFTLTTLQARTRFMLSSRSRKLEKLCRTTLEADECTSEPKTFSLPW